MLTMAVEILVCFGIMVWLLSRKRDEKFSANFALKLVFAGMIPVIIPIALEDITIIPKDLPPLLYGFLSALLAAVVEETLIFLAFRLAVRKSTEVRSSYDAVLSACLVGMGFVLLDDILYTVKGAQLIHAVLLVHFIFAVPMGYCFAKGKVSGKLSHHALSLGLPILGHVLLDTWPYALRAQSAAAVAGSVSVILLAVYGLYALLLILCFVLVARWGRNPRFVAPMGQEISQQQNQAAIASPESMDDYIRVTSPPVWVALAGMLALLVGVFAWASLGHVQTQVRAGAIAENGNVTCFIPLEYAEYLSESSTVQVADQAARYSGSPVRGVQADSAEASLLSEHGIDPASVAAMELSMPLSDGLYWATVTVERLSPLQLILG